MSYLDNSKTQIVAKDLAYPESPAYCSDDSILLVEIRGERLTRVHPDGSTEKVASIPGGPNGLAMAPTGSNGEQYAYICNCGGFEWFSYPPGSDHPTLWIGGNQPANYTGGKIEKVNLGSGEVTELFGEYEIPPAALKAHGLSECKPPYKLRGPDDGVVDSAGGMWISDFGKQRPFERDITSVYYMAPGETSLKQVFYPLNSPNGIALSPDEKWLYIALSYERRVIKYEIAPGGTFKPNPKTTDGSYLVTGEFIGSSVLDSMRVDSEGNLYVVTMLPEGFDPNLNGGITVVSPEGDVLDFIEIKSPDGAIAPMPSSLCFGGTDLKTAYITCGGSGYLLSMPSRIAGLKPNFSC
ncbi:MAG: SMP-30/gluconolactonase/LRE family protein [Gammaproteobacteria bacterium]